MDAKEMLNSLIDENTSRETLDKIAVIGARIDEMEAEHQKTKEEYKELLQDYATVIKNGGFKVDDKSKHDDGHTQKSFEDCAKEWYDNNHKLK